MPKEITLALSPEQAASPESVRRLAASSAGIPVGEVQRVDIIRRSIDARGKSIKVNLRLRLLQAGEELTLDTPKFNYRNVSSAAEVVVVGAGPAGLFAALRLIELGYKPIIVERGRDVSNRKRDIATLNRNMGLAPDSNYAFGEGGAGTFSDGKLYTRSRKRGDTQRILQILHNHGAQDEILFEAHPHIGTNVLPRVISAIRSTIESSGGQFLFNSRVQGIDVSNGRAKGVTLFNGNRVGGVGVILAAGHSASDIYYSLYQQGIALEAKAFAMGVRVEHPQELIDSIQYHRKGRGEYLPAASYSLVHQVEGRGVYSFCMCPGGYIVPAATEAEQIVVNGMSPSGRNSRWANSGIVVEVRDEDFAIGQVANPLQGLEYQRKLEARAYSEVKQGLSAPGQRLTDFTNGKPSSTLPTCSYYPGVVASGLDSWLPKQIGQRLQEGFRAFGRKMRGFITDEAIVVGVESRTSSPVRIPRNPQTLEHIQVGGLFPCGEGAGYAGGIMSSAIDGERAAEALGDG